MPDIPESKPDPKPCLLCGAECITRFPGTRPPETECTDPECVYKIGWALHDCLSRAADCAAEEWVRPEDVTLGIVYLGLWGFDTQAPTAWCYRDNVGWFYPRRSGDPLPCKSPPIMVCKINLPEEKSCSTPK